MAKPKLTVFVDIRSGFTYLAFSVISTSSVFADCDVTYIPIDLRALWASCDNKGAWAVKNKPDWIHKSATLWARKFGISFNGPPDGFRESSTTALMQAVCVVAGSHPERLVEVLKTLYHAFWVERRQLWSREEYLVLFEEVLGKEIGREVAETSSTQEAADQLASNTNTAMKEGGFGLPYFIAVEEARGKQTFWGFDHLGLVVDHLGLEKPNPSPAQDGGWKIMM